MSTLWQISHNEIFWSLHEMIQVFDAIATSVFLFEIPDKAYKVNDHFIHNNVEWLVHAVMIDEPALINKDNHFTSEQQWDKAHKCTRIYASFVKDVKDATKSI